MNNMKRDGLIAVLSCFLVLLSLGGCASEREYQADIHIPLESSQIGGDLPQRKTKAETAGLCGQMG